MKKKSGELTSSPSPSAIAKPSENADEYNVADAVSRSGDRSEAFGGPLIYTVVLLIATLAFFRDSPVGIIAISQMAVGDGLADIVGRRYGIRKWPFSDSKSIGGSLAFAIGAAISSSLLLMLLTSTGCMDVNMASAIPKLIFISILCAGVELVPGVDDNISVPAVGALAAWQLFE
jgi:phytol kinase